MAEFHNPFQLPTATLRQMEGHAEPKVQPQAVEVRPNKAFDAAKQEALAIQNKLVEADMAQTKKDTKRALREQQEARAMRTGVRTTE